MLFSSHSHSSHRPNTPPDMRRNVSLTAMLVVGALGLSACGPGYDDPTEAAEQFGNQLESEQFAALEEAALAHGSIEPATLADSTAALAEFPVSVTLESAAVNEDEAAEHDDAVTATAQYTVTWHLGASVDGDANDGEATRSEEHTSELQSRG